MLTNLIGSQSGISRFQTCLFQGFLSRPGDNILIFFTSIEPGRNPVAPPELSGDTPIPNILHPMPVTVLELGRMKPDIVIHHMLTTRLATFIHFQKPLKEMG